MKTLSWGDKWRELQAAHGKDLYSIYHEFDEYVKQKEESLNRMWDVAESLD